MSKSLLKSGLLWMLCAGVISWTLTAGSGKELNSLQAASITTDSSLTLTEMRQPVKQARVRVFDANGVRSQVVEKTDDLGYATIAIPAGTHFKLEVKVNETIYFTPFYVAPANVVFDTLNKAPATTDMAVSTAEDTAVAITLTATDPENDALTYAVLTQPTNGALSGTAPNLTYTPNPDFFGTDSFTFQADDGILKSGVAKVTITVNPVNDAPVASAVAVAAVTDVPTAITLIGTDVDSAELSYVVVTQPAHGTLSGTGATLTYTHTADVYGTDSFTYKVNDGQADSQVATVTIEVTAPFVITVNATDGQFTIPLKPGLTYDFTATYDGTTTMHVGDASPTITFPSGPGTYDVAISGTFPAIYFNGTGDTTKMLDVKQWGSSAWETMDSAFEDCANMTVTATDTPDLSAVTNMNDTFWKCRSITAIDVSSWDVSNVTSMIQTFRGCTTMTNYVGIKNWDVSKVTTFHRAFYYNRALTSLDLTGWNTSSATDLSYMFYRCDKLTDLTGYQNWDVSKVTSLRLTFERSAMTSIDLSNWNTTDALVDLYATFGGAATTEIKGLTQLDVSNVLYADNMLPKVYAMTTEDYDALLIAWAAQVTQPASGVVTFDANGAQFTPFSEAAAARDSLIAHNWNVVDGGSVVGIDSLVTSSITSPVRVSGWCTVGSVSDFSISTDNATYGAVTPWGDTLWYTDVTLATDEALTVSVKYESTVVKSEDIVWTPTLIDANTSQSVTIRKGHSLLLGSAVQTGTVLEIDTDGDGVYDLSGAPTDTFPVPYNEYGTFQVTTCIDGVDVGYLVVEVPQIHFPQNVACEIGFTRELTVGVPEDVAGDIIFTALDGRELTITTASELSLPGTVKLFITPLTSGTPTIVAKHTDGTVLETKIVDEFDLASQADKFIGVVDEFEDGSMLLRTNLTMTPKVPNLEVRLHIFKAGVTFDDSTLDKTVDTSDFTADAKTGLYLHPYSLIIPPDYVGGPCHTIMVFQDGVQIGQ